MLGIESTLTHLGSFMHPPLISTISKSRVCQRSLSSPRSAHSWGACIHTCGLSHMKGLSIRIYMHRGKTVNLVTFARSSMLNRKTTIGHRIQYRFDIIISSTRGGGVAVSPPPRPSTSSPPETQPTPSPLTPPI